MAYGLKNGGFPPFALVEFSSAAQLPHIRSEEAGSPKRLPLAAMKWRISAVFALRQLDSRTAAQLPQLPQQGGRCGSHRDTPKGVFPDDNCRSPLVRLLNCRSGEQTTPTPSPAP